MVFAVAKKRDAKTIHANNTDINAFCKKVPFEELEEIYTIFGENGEAAEHFLTSAVY